MTAIVSILNKHAVAIAADSAVTFGRKVINSGNKVFTLSKYHPVAIMTYSNASYMGIPLDTLIKVFRKRLGKKEFDTVDKYADEFMNFLHDPTLYYQPEFVDSVANHINAFYQVMINTAKAEIKDFDVKAPDAYEMLKVTLKKYRIIHGSMAKNIEYKGYSYKSFAKECNEAILQFKGYDKRIKNIEIPEDEFEDFIKDFYAYLVTGAMYNDYSGLVFTGYGKTELFPSLVHIFLTVKIGDRIRYYRQPTYCIGNGDAAARIIPFAQTNTEQTIVHGIHPDIKNLITMTFKNILNDIGKGDPNFKTDTYAKLFNDEIDNYIRDNLTAPLMNTVVNLNKEDMADMAESIVYLTSLMKKVSPEEETVGGPVDVAVISKGDGFVWIKRKHYFSPELNPHFTNNYFREEEE